MAGINYVPNNPLDIKQETFNKMRYYFRQFGLGVSTGIDLPNESIGQIGRTDNIPGFLLDYAIGQYDTYTPLQLAQYISTIANGGYRMKPQIVQEVREQPNRPEDVGKVVRSIEPVVLNRVDMDTSYINHVKEGFRRVFKKLTEQVPERLKVYHINQREKQEQLRQYMVEKVILEEMRTTTEKML